MMVRGIFLAVAGLALASCSGGEREPEAKPGVFTLLSQALDEGGAMPAEFTCDGDSLSPPLRWANPPAGTKSYALTLSDPDAPMGTYRHWGAYNIPADRRYVKAGDGLPNAAHFDQVLNSKEERQYLAPCPPPGSGPHRYRFKVIALSKDRIELSPDTRVGGLEEAAMNHKLGEAELVVTYERK